MGSLAVTLTSKAEFTGSDEVARVITGGVTSLVFVMVSTLEARLPRPVASSITFAGIAMRTLAAAGST